MFYNDFLTKETIYSLTLFVSRYKINFGLTELSSCYPASSGFSQGILVSFPYSMMNELVQNKTSLRKRPTFREETSMAGVGRCWRRRTSYSSQNNGSKTLETASNSKATLDKISCNVYDIFAGFIKDKQIKFLFDYLVFFKSIQSYAVPR